MELRTGEKARVTRDVDLLLRGEPSPPEHTSAPYLGLVDLR